MYVVTTAPISRGITKEELSYFSKKEIKPGHIVSVPLRSKTAQALVLKCEKADNLKAEIKSSKFSLKKIEDKKPQKVFSLEYIEAIKKTADYFATTIGATLDSTVPQFIWDNLENLKLKTDSKKTNKFYITSIQTNTEERLAHYKSIIREEFAKNNSVFLCMPTIQDIEKTLPTIKKGIEKYCVVLHSKLSNKELSENIQKIEKEKHPFVIIATPIFTSTLRPDTATIILDNENDPAYKTISRPHIDFRNFVEILAKELEVRLVLGDTLLRIESIYRQKKGIISELSPLSFRSLSNAKHQFVEIKPKKQDEEFRILSPELIKTLRDGKRTFIFCARKSLAPTTVCKDCGTTVLSKHARAPMMLFKKSNQNIFVCPKAGEVKTSKILCEHCGSWNLIPLGIGTEKLEEEIKNTFPKRKIFRLDSQKAKTSKQARKIVEEFYASPGSILVGTEMALSYLNQKIENVFIASVDSLFSIPDFKIQEKIIKLIIEIRDLAESNFILQTRQENQTTLKQGYSGNMIDFYNQELKDRKSFGYPPFKILIKITRSGRQDLVKKDLENLKKTLEKEETYLFPAFISKIKNTFTMHLLIKVSSKEWPNKNVLEILKSLPPTFNISVNPESIL